MDGSGCLGGNWSLSFEIAIAIATDLIGGIFVEHGDEAGLAQKSADSFLFGAVRLAAMPAS